MDGIYDCISMKVFSFFLLVKKKKDYLDYSVLQLKLLAIPSAPFYRDFRDTYCSMQDFLFCFLIQFARRMFLCALLLGKAWQCSAWLLRGSPHLEYICGF